MALKYVVDNYTMNTFWGLFFLVNGELDICLGNLLYVRRNYLHGTYIPFELQLKNWILLNPLFISLSISKSRSRSTFMVILC